MNTIEAAAFTNIPEELLQRMRSRETTTTLGGPPVKRTVSKMGEIRYIYEKRALKAWLKYRSCRITAKDAAIILGTSRDELLTRYGIHSYDIRTKDYKGRLVVDNGHSIYMWVPSKKK